LAISYEELPTGRYFAVEAHRGEDSLPEPILAPNFPEVIWIAKDQAGKRGWI
jgi:hypothetical protein